MAASSSSSSQQWSWMQWSWTQSSRAALCARGRGWACATEAAIESASALEKAVLLVSCKSGPPLPIRGIAGKQRPTADRWGAAWGQAPCTILRLGRRAFAMVFSAPAPSPTFFMAQKYIKTTELEVLAIRSFSITLQRKLFQGQVL